MMGSGYLKYGLYKFSEGVHEVDFYCGIRRNELTRIRKIKRIKFPVVELLGYTINNFYINFFFICILKFCYYSRLKKNKKECSWHT